MPQVPITFRVEDADLEAFQALHAEASAITGVNVGPSDVHRRIYRAGLDVLRQGRVLNDQSRLAYESYRKRAVEAGDVAASVDGIFELGLHQVAFGAELGPARYEPPTGDPLAYALRSGAAKPRTVLVAQGVLRGEGLPVRLAGSMRPSWIYCDILLRATGPLAARLVSVTVDGEPCDVAGAYEPARGWAVVPLSSPRGASSIAVEVVGPAMHEVTFGLRGFEINPYALSQWIERLLLQTIVGRNTGSGY